MLARQRCDVEDAFARLDESQRGKERQHHVRRAFHEAEFAANGFLVRRVSLQPREEIKVNHRRSH